MRGNRATAGLAAVLAVLAVAGCSSTKRADMTCPRLVTAPAADAIALFKPGSHEAKDVMVGGKIYASSIACRREKVGIAVNTEIVFYAERAAPEIKDARFPYFVALLDANQQVVVENAFVAPIAFLPGETYRRTLPEKITVDLPVKDQAAGASYAVVIGFQLTPEQLAFNRSMRPQ